MLMRSDRVPPHRVRQLWHDAVKNAPSLGCATCPEKSLCGGVCVAAPYFDCLTYCCGKPEKCTAVCRKNEAFARRVWEVEGFALSNTPRAARLESPDLPQVIPIFYHSGSRNNLASPGTAALPLCRTFARRSGETRLGTPDDLRREYRLAPDTTVILTGIGEDAPIERWWGLGEKQRRGLIKAMRGAGVAMVTVPNYSLTVNAPRWDDLHAMKRIGLVHAEFLSEGMPAALHVNGRTDQDFDRWTEFVAAREEITHIAYEFTTGSRWAHRREQHVAWLSAFAVNAGRPLHLIVRGGTDLLKEFVAAFAHVTVLETDSFMWTMKRQQAVMRGNSGVRRRPAPTEKGAPLDDLLAINLAANRTHIESRLGVPRQDGASGTA